MNHDDRTYYLSIKAQTPMVLRDIVLDTKRIVDNKDAPLDAKATIYLAIKVIYAFLEDTDQKGWPENGIALISGPKIGDKKRITLFEPSDSDGSHLSISRIENLNNLKPRYPDAPTKDVAKLFAGLIVESDSDEDRNWLTAKIVNVRMLMYLSIFFMF